MKKVLVIAGPTASGKSSFSIEIAHILKTEIISGDSIQVYRGEDIGSGKIKEEEKEGVQHHLLDILNPNEQYTVKTFQEMARKIINELETIPIIVGGTGLYLKSCLYDYEFLEEEGPSIEESLEIYSNMELYQKLLEVDPLQAEKIHPNNRRRLLRSLTIALRSGKPQSEQIAKQKHEPIYDIFIAGCTMPREVLYEKINQRVHQMMEDGLEKEVQTLLEKGYTFDDPGLRGIGYQEWKEYFAKNRPKEDVEKEIAKPSRNYAKRHYTWLKHQMPVKWFDVLDQEEHQKMIEEIILWAKND
ncbi:MAG: tRNA (adenosine(37)-N6)-dimethylallyltransferase MiaA [Solobacterium sp.]|nr:tRNA (adenosine(37)-N6)-dimethylallyltransferase MiaA [Solobacterium sp.]